MVRTNPLQPYSFAELPASASLLDERRRGDSAIAEFVADALLDFGFEGTSWLFEALVDLD